MDPFGFIFFANNRGLINANLNTPLYQSGYDKSGNANMLSVDSNGIPVQYQSPTKADTLLDSTYKIFFEQPANDLPPDIKTTAYAPGTIKDFKFMGDADSSGFVGVGGYFYFTATKTSSFQIKLDFTNSGTNTGIVYLANACVEGVNRVFWDGKDANGVVVPAGTYGGPASNIRISIIAKAGEYHFPMLDVEGNKNGIKIEMISNPLDAGGNPIAVSAVDRSTVYYNNSFVDAIRNANPTTQNMLGGMDSSTGASKYYDAQGNVSALDIWTYYRGTPSQNPEVSPSAFVLKPSEDKANVRGFVFYDTDQNGQYKMIAGDYSLSGVTVSLYSAGVLAATTTTDTTGLYSFSGIAYGEYEVRIVKPYDYAVCTTTIAVPNLSQVLTANNNGWTRMADVGFMYAKTDKMISVSKLWAVSTAVDKTQPTSVTVSVIGYNNAVPEVTKTILLSTTNGWKYSFSDLPKYAADGVTVLRYQVEEEPIAGYIQDIISADLPGEIKYTLTNSHKGQILLTKVDSNDPSRKLEGATFEFWRKGDSTPIDTVTTDENGEIYKSGLTAGTYYFKEITAPVGYTFESADAVTADIVIDYTDAGNSKSVTVKNTPQCNFTLTKTITAASDMDEQFLFEITGPTGSYYYAVITIPKGQTSASQKFTGMPVGTYNVVEKCSNWRYSIQTASTYAADGTTTFPYAGGQLSMLIDKPLNTGYQFAFVDSRTVTAWVSDHSSVTNTMVKPVMVPVVTPTVTPTPTVTVIPTVIPTVVPTVIPTVVPTVTVTPPTPTPPAVTYVRVSSITDGGTYVIVAQNVSGNYALTSAVYKSHYLSGVSVTVTGNNLAAEDVTNAMLWTFKADGNGYDVMNGTNYLNRKTTSGGTGLTVGAEGTADVSDWEYLDAGHYLYTTYHSYFYDNYYDMYQIANPPGPYYFGQGTGVPGTIYLYKRVTP